MTIQINRRRALGEGQVDPEFFKMLASTGFRGPLSLHEAYLDHRSSEGLPQHLVAIKKGLATLIQWLDR